MAETCDKIFMPEDMTIGMVVGERLNCFKYSYVLVMYLSIHV